MSQKPGSKVEKIKVDDNNRPTTSNPNPAPKPRIAPLVYVPTQSKSTIKGAPTVVGGARLNRLPILRPKLPRAATSTTADRPLIAILDNMDFTAQKKKPYYTEMRDIRQEFEVPESIDTDRPTTISAIQLAEKLRSIQWLRGENKYLEEAISKKNYTCNIKSDQIGEIRHNTQELHNQCQVFRSSVRQLEAEIDQIKKGVVQQ